MLHLKNNAFLLWNLETRGMDTVSQNFSPNSKYPIKKCSITFIIFLIALSWNIALFFDKTIPKLSPFPQILEKVDETEKWCGISFHMFLISLNSNINLLF